MSTPRWPDTAARNPEKDTTLDPLAIETIMVRRREPWRKLGLLMQPAPALEIRRFADAGLQASIDRALASIPADTRMVDLEIGADARGVQMVTAARLSAGWSLAGGVSFDYGGQWGGTIGIRKEWK